MNEKWIIKNFWWISIIMLIIVSVCILLVTHRYLYPITPSQDASNTIRFVSFAEIIAMLYFTAWAMQMLFGGPYIGIRAALNASAIMAAITLALWVMTGDQEMYKNARSLQDIIDATSELIFILITLASILVGWVWLLRCLFKWGFQAGQLSRWVYEYAARRP